MTDLLRQVAARRAGSPAPQTRPRPSGVVVVADEAAAVVVVDGDEEGGDKTETAATGEAAQKEDAEEDAEDAEARELRAEKQREWAEEERAVERAVQRYTARLAGGWQQRFREQAARDADPSHAHTHSSDGGNSTNEGNSTSGGNEGDSSSLLGVTAADALVGDGGYAAHDIDSLLAADTPAAREHLRQQCLRRKRRRVLGAAPAPAGDPAPRPFADEHSRHLLRRIQRTNVAAAPAAPQGALAREDSLSLSLSLSLGCSTSGCGSAGGSAGSSSSSAAASLAVALRGLRSGAGARSPEPGRAAVAGALFRTVSSPAAGTDPRTDDAAPRTARTPPPAPAAGAAQAKSRSLFQLLSQHQSK